MRRQDSNLRPPGYEPDELPTALLRDIDLVPVTGLEPVQYCYREILSLLCLPFHHTGSSSAKIKIPYFRGCVKDKFKNQKYFQKIGLGGLHCPPGETEQKGSCLAAGALYRYHFGTYRNLRIPSVAQETSPLMVTVNLMLFRSPNTSSQFRNFSVSTSTSAPMVLHRLSMNTWEMS